MKSQNEIILETEMTAEQCRKNIATLKAKLTNLDFKKSLISLENLLFNCTVLLYTHRTIWSQVPFWSEYATSHNPIEFAESSYNQMISCVLTGIYSDLYFEIESALYKYLALNNHKIEKRDCQLLTLYSKLDSSLIHNYTETQNGLICLRNIRNSYHGNMGKFIFTHQDVDVSFKNEVYQFRLGMPISVSYRFLRDFFASITDMYIILFGTTSQAKVTA